MTRMGTLRLRNERYSKVTAGFPRSSIVTAPSGLFIRAMLQPSFAPEQVLTPPDLSCPGAPDVQADPLDNRSLAASEDGLRTYTHSSTYDRQGSGERHCPRVFSSPASKHDRLQYLEKNCIDFAAHGTLTIRAIAW